jgi:hypothetical protein
LAGGRVDPPDADAGPAGAGVRAELESLLLDDVLLADQPEL